MPENEEKIFLRVSASLKDAWKRTTRARKIDQNEAGRALIDWINRQDDQVQLMIFGQAEPQPDLIELILGRLARERHSAKVREGGGVRSASASQLSDASANAPARKHGKK